VWSRGVVFEYDGVQVKVEEVRKDKRLIFSAKGKDNIPPGTSLQVIAHQLETIHDGYPGIQFEKIVPCPCVDCKNSKDPTLFYYHKLMKWLAEGKNPIRCNESQEDIQIWEVLGHIGVDSKEVTNYTFKNNLMRTVKLGKPSTHKSLKVFISYSKSDKTGVENELKPDLKNLERKGKIRTWYDGDLLAGSEWDEEIRQRLREADIILLMVSRKFIATDYIWDVEIKNAIKRHNEGKAIVIPIILSDCIWTGDATPFSKLSALPKKGKPISSFDNQDAAWTSVLEGIDEVIELKLQK